MNAILDYVLFFYIAAFGLFFVGRVFGLSLAAVLS